MYKFVIRPAILYGLETAPLTKKNEAEREVAELKRLRFSTGITRMDMITNDYIRGTARLNSIKNKLRKTKLRWYGHILRKKNSYVAKRIIAMSLSNKWKRGRPKRRFADAIKEDMIVAEVNEDDSMDREKSRQMICCGDP